MNQREAFHAMMAFEHPSLPCQFEWGYWPETLARWRKEGLPHGVEPWDDCGIIHYLRPPIQRGIFPPFPVEVLQDDETSRIVRSDTGIILRESKVGQSVPQFIKHPVANREDFEALKGRLDPDTPGRYLEPWDEWVARASSSARLVCVGGGENGFFGWPRRLMGLEGLSLAYVDQPELVHEICRHQVSFLQRLYERVLRTARVDFIFMWEDMAYKNGPLISPAFFRTFMLPYYRELVDYYRQMGVRWIVVDSDGDITQLIPLFVEAGVDGLLPFEVAAGNDIRRVRQVFPRLRILGGLDKRALARGRQAIDAELESKLPAMFRAGGYLPTLDHHVPPEVPYADFRYYLERCREHWARGR